MWWLIRSDTDSDCTFYGCSLFPYLFLFLTIKDDLIAKYGSQLLPRLIISRLENGHWASFLYLLKEQSSFTPCLTLSACSFSLSAALSHAHTFMSESQTLFLFSYLHFLAHMHNPGKFMDINYVCELHKLCSETIKKIKYLWNQLDSTRNKTKSSEA